MQFNYHKYFDFPNIFVATQTTKNRRNPLFINFDICKIHVQIDK